MAYADALLRKDVTNFTNLTANPITSYGGVYTIGYTFLSVAGDVESIDYAAELDYYGLFSQEGANIITMNANIKAAVELALQPAATSQTDFSAFFADVALVHFDPNGNDAIAIGTNNSSNPIFSGSSNVGGYTYTSITQNFGEGHYGDIWFNDGYAGGWASVAEGTKQFAIVMHELGHSLGLDYASVNFDNGKYTVVTDTLEHPDMSNSIFPAGLQLFDIAALQDIYGANFSTRDEATTYTFGSSQAFGASVATPFTYSIWDGGGIDEVNAFGYQLGSQIDLRQGRFSSIGQKDLSGAPVAWDSGTYDAGNVSIAYHAIIENARGTEHADKVVGNAWDNVLYGMDGADYLYGDGVVYDNDAGYGAASGEYDPNHQDGAPSADFSGSDRLHGGGGDDHLYGGKGNDFLWGDDFTGQVYANTLDGGHGFDVVSYDYSSLDDLLYDLEVVATNRNQGVFEVTKSYSGGTAVVDTLEGIERIAHAEHLANAYITGNQTEGSITGVVGSDLVVVWKSQGQAGYSTGIYAQRFDINGNPVGPQIEVSNIGNTSKYNLDAQIVDTQDGGFAVAWQGREGSRRKVFASKFNSSGGSVFGQKVVFDDPNTGNPAIDNLKKTQEFQPSITVLSNGNLAISAEAYGDAMNYADIITQVLDSSSGARLGANEDVAINQTTTGNQVASQVEALANGGYVLTWTDASGADGSQSGIFGRIMTAQGAATGSEFQINQSDASHQVSQHVTGVSDGTFLVAWASSHDGGNYDIYFRHFDASGTALSGEIRVNDSTVGAQVDPEIVMLDDTRFVVVFQDQDSSADGSAAAILAQQYRIDNTNGTHPAVGENFVVNVTTDGTQREPTIGKLDGGDFAVGWTSPEAGGSPGDEVFFRVFSTADSAQFNTQTGMIEV